MKFSDKIKLQTYQLCFSTVAMFVILILAILIIGNVINKSDIYYMEIHAPKS